MERRRAVPFRSRKERSGRIHRFRDQHRNRLPASRRPRGRRAGPGCPAGGVHRGCTGGGQVLSGRQQIQTLFQRLAISKDSLCKKSLR